MRNIFEYHDEGIYLEHHGILGQKWGIRRYQNRDGTLTAEGKQRYNDDYTENDLKRDITEALEFGEKSYSSRGGLDAYLKQDERISRIRDGVPALKKLVNEARQHAQKLDSLDQSEDTKKIEQITDKVNGLYQDYFREFSKVVKRYSGETVGEASFFAMCIEDNFWLQIPNFGY